MHTINDVGVGKLLLAEPFMEDTNFKRSVVFMCDHHDEGSVGFQLNKQLRVNIDQLIEGFPKCEAPVFVGGPVEAETVHYIHTRGDILESSQRVIDGVYWGGDFEQLKALISAKLIGPHDIRFYLGYSGWGPGQLEQEMAEFKSWIVADGDPNYIFFHEDTSKLWETVLQNKGDRYSVISTFSDENRLN